MKRNILLYTGFGLTLLLWFLNYIAIINYYFWIIWWYDYMMHFLGGFIIGVIIIWTYYTWRDVKVSLSTVLLWVIAIGVAWEIYEYMLGAVSVLQKYEIDTTHDLIMDLIGGSVAYLFASSLPSQESSQES